MKTGFSKCKLAAGIFSAVFVTAAAFMLGAGNVFADEEPSTTEPLDGWVISSDITYYYQDGTAVTGWQKIDGDSFYFYKANKDGHVKGQMATGFLSDGGFRYYLIPDETEGHREGAMATGFQSIEGQRYYFYRTSKDDHEKGQMATGWQSIDGARYYFFKSNSY